MLTCEHGRGAESAPPVVEPTAVPTPLAAAPVQVEHVAEAARVPQDRPIEEHVGRVPVGWLLPSFGDEVLVFPEGLEHLRIEANVSSVLETLQLLFADDRAFAVLQHRFEIDLGEVHFGERKRTLVFLDDGPSVVNEGDGVESEGAVDGDDLLQDGSENRVPVRIVHQDADGVQNLTRGGLVHLGIS